MLCSHPQVVAYTELFLPTGTGTPEWSRVKDLVYYNTWLSEQPAWLRLARPLAVGRYLDYVYNRHPDKGAIGFKLMYSQILRRPAILAQLRRRQVAILNLVRHNLLDVHLSGLVKAKRASAHSEASVETVQVRVDAPALLRELRRKRRNMRIASNVLSHSGCPYLELSYDDLRSDAGALDPVWQLLELPPVEASSSLQKISPASHAEIIENYDEVCETLRGTDFEKMLH